jgi:hypothetical protein
MSIRDDTSSTTAFNATTAHHLAKQSVPLAELTARRANLKTRGGPRKMTISGNCTHGNCSRCFSLGCPHECHGSGRLSEVRKAKG